jgi:hypothetical protein
VKRASQEGNLEACLLRLRPMRVRKVDASGTKGIGAGIGRTLDELWRERVLAQILGSWVL